MARKRSIGEVEGNTRVTLATTFRWTIRNFRQLDQADSLSVESSKWSNEVDPKTKWWLRLDKVRGLEWIHQRYMSLYLNCKTDREVVKAVFSFAMIDHRGEVIIKSFSHDFTKESPKWGDNKFSLWYLFDLTLNRVTIECQVSYDTGIDASDVSEMPKTKKLAKILENLYNSRQSSGDFMVEVAGKEFRAHKAILRARSPVFDEMFEHSFKESIENRVKIPDISEDIFEAVLEFMYTADIGRKDIDFEQLFVAADYFQMNDLKVVCEDEMASKLSVDTVCDVFMLADRHSAQELKERAVQFFRANKKAVMATNGWKEMSRNDLDYIVERMI